jgi:Uma2 family endonuclease
MSLAEDRHAGAPRFESAGAFLAWAERQPERWELVDGVAKMMTGGSLNHSRLGRNALTVLVARLGVGPCEAFGSDAAVVLGPRRVAFPDVSVSCEAETGTSVVHPVVVVEVLSPSTESYDLGHKAAAYRRLPSLRHLVFIHQDQVAVQHFHREATGQEFSLTEINRVDGRLLLAAIGVEITLGELYAQVMLAG